MILKGNSRGNGRELALHLLNVDDNEHATVHELRGFSADDLMGAFRETEAISLGTKCEQYLFSLSLSPPSSASVSIEDFEAVIAIIEQRLGLEGQPRAVVFHEKKGRRHAHCVWSRINIDKMRAINLSHYKHKLMDISRDLYLEHEWEMPAGFQNHDDRDRLNYSHAEAGQAKRVKRNPADLKELFRSCLASSDSRSAFAAALWSNGFCLARGDRRGFVAVDAHGEVYSLSRWCGVKAKELRARLGDNDDLPDVEEAVRLLSERPSRARPDDSFERVAKAQRQKVADLVARQRQERVDLAEAQETQRLAAIKQSQSQLPTGIKAAWERLTGSYQAKIDHLTQEAENRETNFQTETQAMIERHLAERRALDREFEFVKAQHAFEAEFQSSAERVAERTYSPDPRQPLVLQREPVPFTVDQLKRKPGLILDHISDKQASFSRNDVVRGLAEFIDEPVELRLAIDQALASSELVTLDGKTGAEFTTRDYQHSEQRLMQGASTMAKSGSFGVRASTIKKALKRENTRLKRAVGAQLSDEQINAIQHVLGSSQLSAVVGLAGTGKSTLLSVARNAWEQQGYTIHGLALAGKAADSLQSASGIQSRTLASVETSWKNGHDPIAHGSVVVVDEAGMVGTRQLARVTEQLQKLDCKLVLVGDPDQLQPIQAGTPFRNIVDTQGAAQLSEIRRQKSEWQRQASRDLASGNTAMAIRNYFDHGAVRETDNLDQAIATLVDDYIADEQTNGSSKSRLVLAHRRKDVHAINQAIRAARKTSGKPQVETLFKTGHGPRAFSAGDRLLFTRNDRDLGVRNGMLATVESVSDTQITVRIDQDGHNTARKLTFSPRNFPSIDHGFAVTIHRSQGSTIDQSYVLSSRTLDENLSYVALTRHREDAKFYTAPEIEPRYLKRETNMYSRAERERNRLIRLR